MERNKSVSTSLPFPMMGENSRDPLLNMDPRFAVSMINFFPRGNNGELRKGYRVHSSGMGTGSVATLAEHTTAAGVKKLIACANGRIYDATTLSGTATSLASGFTNNYWQTVNYLGNLILVNGSNQPQKYDGSSVSAATYTGIADDANLVDVTVFKERLYFAEKNSTKFWYGSAGAITGALTDFEVGDFLRLGGYIQTISSWTSNTGSGLQDLLVIVSSEGEVLAYSGTDPATDFALDARFIIPRPHGRRCKKNFGADLFLLHQEGITSMSQLLGGINVSEGFIQFTDAISPTFTRASNSFGSNTNWEIFFHPRSQWGGVNVPVASNKSYQFIMNTRTGAWCQFRGINSITWGLFDDKIYFGGTDGKVYQADITDADNGSAIDANVKFAFNFFGDESRLKLFHLASAQVTSSGSVNFFFSIDVDGSNDISINTVDISTTAGSEWDVSSWDTTDWGAENTYSTNWEGVNGIGRAAALKIAGKFKDVSLQIASAQIQFEVGGYL